MQTRIFVLATHWEGMPLALVEAMAAGCACVASHVPGVEGVLEDGVTGLLVPEADPRRWQRRWLACCATRPLAARLGTAARARVPRRPTARGRCWRATRPLLDHGAAEPIADAQRPPPPTARARQPPTMAAGASGLMASKDFRCWARRVGSPAAPRSGRP